MREPDPAGDLLERSGVAYASVESPLGPLQLAAGPDGLARLAFEDHGDFAAMRERAGRRRGGVAAREHLRTATDELERYFAGELERFTVPVDWAALGAPLGEVLRAATAIPYGRRRSYSDLGLQVPPRDIARGYGANPVPVVVACHRVTRGAESPDAFVGGVERRRWLESHERGRG